MPRHELLALVTDLVPPGRGYRYRERKRANNRRRQHLRARAAKHSFDDQVSAGQRSIVMESLTQMVRLGTLRREDIDGKVWLSWPD